MCSMSYSAIMDPNFPKLRNFLPPSHSVPFVSLSPLVINIYLGQILILPSLFRLYLSCCRARHCATTTSGGRRGRGVCTASPRLLPSLTRQRRLYRPHLSHNHHSLVQYSTVQPVYDCLPLYTVASEIIYE